MVFRMLSLLDFFSNPIRLSKWPFLVTFPIKAGFKKSLVLICFAAGKISAQDEIPKDVLESEQIESFTRKAGLLPPSAESSLPIIDTVEGMMRAIREQDFTRAYFAFSSKEFRRVTSLDSFSHFVKTSPVLIKNKTISTTKILTYGNNAVYYAVGVAQDGTAVNIKYDLIIENGSWKILGIQLNVKP